MDASRRSAQSFADDTSSGSVQDDRIPFGDCDCKTRRRCQTPRLFCDDITDLPALQTLQAVDLRDGGSDQALHMPPQRKRKTWEAKVKGEGIEVSRGDLVGHEGGADVEAQPKGDFVIGQGRKDVTGRCQGRAPLALPSPEFQITVERAHPAVMRVF